MQSRTGPWCAADAILLADVSHLAHHTLNACNSARSASHRTTRRKGMPIQSLVGVLLRTYVAVLQVWDFRSLALWSMEHTEFVSTPSFLLLHSFMYAHIELS